RRRLGREALGRVAQPLVAGIYTADPDDLSLTATMPRFTELERRERSVILGLWRANRRAPQAGTSGARWSLFVTFQNGMEELVTALASRLPPGSVMLKHRVDGIERRGGGWRVLGGPGRAPEGHALLRCFVGGALNGHVLESDDPALVAGARDELRQALGITAEPVLTRVARFTKAMPQYHVGHAGRVEAIEQCAAALPGLHLAGGAYRGVGIADCVRSGEAAAERVFSALDRSEPA